MVTQFVRSRRWLFALAIAGMLPVPAEAAEPSWWSNYAGASREAARTGRPVVILVESRSCGWCQELERTTLRDAKVVRALNGSTVPLKINAEDSDHAALLAALRVEALPTIAVIAPDGRVLANRSGYLDAPSFLGLLRSVIADGGK
ncbi:MAG: hypothetical protein NVSMB9_12240 [Isosphaeraceae bacterium]